MLFLGMRTLTFSLTFELSAGRTIVNGAWAIAEMAIDAARTIPIRRFIVVMRTPVPARRDDTCDYDAESRGVVTAPRHAELVERRRCSLGPRPGSARRLLRPAQDDGACWHLP